MPEMCKVVYKPDTDPALDRCLTYLMPAAQVGTVQEVVGICAEQYHATIYDSRTAPFRRLVWPTVSIGERVAAIVVESPFHVSAAVATQASVS